LPKGEVPTDRLSGTYSNRAVAMKEEGRRERRWRNISAKQTRIRPSLRGGSLMPKKGVVTALRKRHLARNERKKVICRG